MNNNDNMDPSVRRRTAPMRFAPMNRRVKEEPEVGTTGLDGGGKVGGGGINPAGSVGVGMGGNRGDFMEEEPLFYDELPIKVLQTPVSMFEFKGTVKFNVDNVQFMDYQRKGLNAYGNDCDAVKDKEEDKMEEEANNNTGANTVYGEKERLEARKRRLKRLGFPDSKKGVIKEEVTLRVKDETASYHKVIGKPRTMKDIQGSYYILMQDPIGEYHAHPVKDWCTFDHKSKNKPLDEQQAEQLFKKRHEVLNMFSVMVGKKLKDGNDSDDDCVMLDPKKDRNKSVDDSDIEYMDCKDWDSDDADEYTQSTPESSLKFIFKKKARNTKNACFTIEKKTTY